jgi:hypothetical protein
VFVVFGSSCGGFSYVELDCARGFLSRRHALGRRAGKPPVNDVFSHIGICVPVNPLENLGQGGRQAATEENLRDSLIDQCREKPTSSGKMGLS